MKRVFCFTPALLVASSLQAQQPQIPTLQVCNPTTVTGSGLVKIDKRAGGGASGSFQVRVDIRCDQSGYPTGSLSIIGLSMTDSIVQGQITSTLIEQVTTTGRDTPTAYINGRCNAQTATGAAPIPCRYWIMFADNKVPSVAQTPDIVGFLVFNGNGQRIAYGTGPLVQGDIRVGPTSF